MLRVFICEDNPVYLASVKKIVDNYVMMQNLAMQVVCAATSPTEVIEYLDNNKSVAMAGLYFLDLDLNCDIDGISLAETIRKYDPRGFIVFITADGDSHRLTFEHKVEAMDYIVKDRHKLQNRICECIDNAIAKFSAKDVPLQDNFVFKTSKDVKRLGGSYNLAKDAVVVLDRNKIFYFMTNPNTKHTVVVISTEGRMEFNGSLKQVEKELDKEHFYRCQNNLIVNIDKVISVDPVQCTVLLEGGHVVDVAARQVKKMKERVEKHSSSK